MHFVILFFCWLARKNDIYTIRAFAAVPPLIIFKINLIEFLVYPLNPFQNGLGALLKHFLTFKAEMVVIRL